MDQSQPADWQLGLSLTFVQCLAWVGIFWRKAESEVELLASRQERYRYPSNHCCCLGFLPSPDHDGGRLVLRSFGGHSCL
jgi:hypothetical protein